MANQDLLTKVEAVEYMKSGTLPDNFTERLKNFVEFYECENCDGVRDMNIRMRTWDVDEPSWCPHCMTEEDIAREAEWQEYRRLKAKFEPDSTPESDPEFERLLAEEEEIERNVREVGRREYVLTDEQYDKAIIQWHHENKSIDDIWLDLGREIGFDGKTVEVMYNSIRRFTAIPIF